MGALLALTLVPTPARAYRRSVVDTDPNTPLYWPQREVEVEIASATSMDVGTVDLSAAAQRSLASWSLAGGCTDMVLAFGGETESTRTSLGGGTYDGANRVVFRESGWPDPPGPGTLAITTLYYRRSTGEILDADIDVNAVDHSWAIVAGPDAVNDDVENTLTHELGHLLGFAHSPEVGATMFASAEAGETSKRDLDADDLAAVCETYPVDGPTPGFQRPALTSGCSAGHSPSAGHARGAGPGLAMLGLALVAWRRRARAAR